MSDQMAVPALMWALDQPTRVRRTLLDGYKLRRVTLFDPWPRTVDHVVNPAYGTSADTWIIRQYVGAPV
jgi:hypothetical protein